MVYPSSANLFTLMRGDLSPGSMSASLALLDNCSKGSSVLQDARNDELSGRNTSLSDFPFFGKSISSRTKCDIAPESMTNFIVCCHSILLVHLFVFVFFIVCAVGIAFVWSALSSSSASWSGAQ